MYYEHGMQIKKLSETTLYQDRKTTRAAMLMLQLSFPFMCCTLRGLKTMLLMTSGILALSGFSCHLKSAIILTPNYLFTANITMETDVGNTYTKHQRQ